MAHFYETKDVGHNLREDEQKMYEVEKAATSATTLIGNYLTRYISATEKATIRYIIVGVDAGSCRLLLS